MASKEDIASDSLDIPVTELPDNLTEYVKTKVAKYISRAKDVTAEIHRVQGKQTKLVLTFAGQQAKTFAPRLCHIRKWADYPGYGFNLHAERGRIGQYIGKVDDGSPAKDGGLQEGDRIIEINGVNVKDESHHAIVQRVQSGGDEIKMLVVDNEANAYYKKQGITVRSTMPEVKLLSNTKRGSGDKGRQILRETNAETVKTNTILVKNLPPSVDEDVLEIFFESTKKQGGGPVKNVKIIRGKNAAIVEFYDESSVDTVLKKRPITFGKTELDIDPFNPVLHTDETICRIDLQCLSLPIEFSENLFLQQL